MIDNYFFTMVELLVEIRAVLQKVHDTFLDVNRETTCLRLPNTRDASITPVRFNVDIQINIPPCHIPHLHRRLTDMIGSDYSITITQETLHIAYIGCLPKPLPHSIPSVTKK